MNWLTERQKVLSENVANVDTPGYTPRDLKPLDFKTMLASVGIGRSGSRLQATTTDPQHLSVGSGGRGGAAVAEKMATAEKNLSGNAVSLDSELMKVSTTATDYQLTTSLYRKQLGLFRMVLGNGGGQS
ncbi:MAG: flagellar basal body rod protein FlgB [Rhodospirillales bacterium]|nr:flagellar basal body rod protein FlgB [Rhodospirillales bacterium]